MTWFMLGADRTHLRLLLGHDLRVLADETIAAQAKERSELPLIQAWLKRQGQTWQTIDRIGVLVLPHSHTSVRVLVTLSEVAGWFFNVPVVHIPTPELSHSLAGELRARLTTLA